MDGEFDYIVSSLPQRRQRDFDNRKTEKQIFTKLVFRHGLVKVAMRRGNHSAIYRDRLPATHALNHLFLEETQYLHLELGHEIANFIEEKSAPFRVLELSATKYRCAGERSFLI